MIKYIVIEMWSNWCFYVLQLKVKVYKTFIKGYLAIFFFNVGTDIWIFNFCILEYILYIFLKFCIFCILILEYS